MLGEGLEVGTVDISTAVDAQLNDQFLFSVSEIARCLGVRLGADAIPGHGWSTD